MAVVTNRVRGSNPWTGLSEGREAYSRSTRSERWTKFDTHVELHKRRSDEDLVAILAEALERLRERPDYDRQMNRIKVAEPTLSPGDMEES